MSNRSYTPEETALLIAIIKEAKEAGGKRLMWDRIQDIALGAGKLEVLHGLMKNRDIVCDSCGEVTSIRAPKGVQGC